jgi:hypothetical protein
VEESGPGSGTGLRVEATEHAMPGFVSGERDAPAEKGTRLAPLTATLRWSGPDPAPFRPHRTLIGSHWRKLDCGQQAPPRARLPAKAHPPRATLLPRGAGRLARAIHVIDHSRGQGRLKKPQCQPDPHSPRSPADMVTKNR